MNGDDEDELDPCERARDKSWGIREGSRQCTTKLLLPSVNCAPSPSRGLCSSGMEARWVLTGKQNLYLLRMYLSYHCNHHERCPYRCPFHGSLFYTFTRHIGHMTRYSGRVPSC